MITLIILLAITLAAVCVVLTIGAALLPVILDLLVAWAVLYLVIRLIRKKKTK